MAEIKTKTAEGGKLKKPNTGPERSRRAYNILSTFFFYLAILFFLIGFNFSDNPAGGWTQQFMPDLGGAQISDITFVDSLNGFATTLYRTANDSAFLLKTTNGGDNWNINQTYNYPFYKVQFINRDTGFALSFQKLFKTTNRGSSWQIINIALSTAFVSMYVLSTDTIWGVATESLTGGVYRTTNGGGSWEHQLALGSQNPNHIYMFNGRIGFICKDNVYLRRTTNSGLNWDTISGAGGFLDMYFVDSLTGWKVNGNLLKTINGGLNWTNQILPSGGNILDNNVYEISKISADTLWSFGGYIIVGGTPPTRGLLFRTVDAGNNWLFQFPDTSIHIVRYFYGEFVNNKTGWAYHTLQGGVHTTTGGDPVFYTEIKQISSKTSEEFKLFPNYPNPFNPITTIKASLSPSEGGKRTVKLIVYDITGKEIAVLLNGQYSAGTYEVTFDGSDYSSGVYFYSLVVNGKLIDTKRMVLIK